MAVKTESTLNEQQRAHWLKAVAAIELRNFGYAISLLQGILREEPEFLTGRMLLRRAEVAKSKAAKKSMFNISTAPIAVMKAQREVRKDPKRAVEMIEKVLEEEPYHRQANLLLKEAAISAGWPEIGIFAMRTLLEEDPRDIRVLHELGRLYHALGQSEEEVEVYNRITEIDPLDSEAVRLAKDASARASMASGGWTQAATYRDLIKDKELAVSLEQQSRMKLSEESLEEQIAETHAAHQAQPENVDLARRLGILNEQKKDLDSAIGWFQYAADLTKGSDAGLVRKVADLKIKKLDRRITEHEELLAASGGEEHLYAKRSEELRNIKQQRAELLIGEARKRVERNPTDLQLRFELGEHLVNAGRYREAVPELQRARQNPNARLRAMNLLGRSYAELGMLDLAARQLADAAKESLAMDAMKKEIVYNLGLVYERMGEREKSLECMKQIYESDYGYKDVATRVEGSYEQKIS
ncbi:MAG TPA: tetratricopeptide repeat protein [Chthoniobacterales bacterium]|jgi:tetratricopeptide (TPR) repeat protein|nr:tetratricopeptide repeat protein [Chthoniobacterales bacterium]